MLVSFHVQDCNWTKSMVGPVPERLSLCKQDWIMNSLKSFNLI